MTVDRLSALAGLVEKRAEIAGQISHTRATLRQLIIDLDHVDAAIRIIHHNFCVFFVAPSLAFSALSPNCRVSSTVTRQQPITQKPSNGGSAR